LHNIKRLNKALPSNNNNTRRNQYTQEDIDSKPQGHQQRVISNNTPIQACRIKHSSHSCDQTNWSAGYKYLSCILIREERLPTLICGVVTPHKFYFIWPDFVMNILHWRCKTEGTSLVKLCDSGRDDTALHIYLNPCLTSSDISAF
jgi:hypothetical protein